MPLSPPLIRTLAFFAILLVTLLFTARPAISMAPIELDDREKAWLSQDHLVHIRIATWPPFMFNDAKGPRGFSLDYITTIFDRHGIRYQWITDTTLAWADSLQKIRERSGVDMVPTINRTTEREEYIAFTRNYLSMPWVIFTRKDAEFVSGLQDLKGRTVTAPQGYVVKSLLENDFPDIRLRPSSSVQESLRMVAVGTADAFVGNLAVGSYLIETLGLSNLKVAAPTPFGDHTQAMGIRKDWPELASIIDKSLAAISPEEHTVIRNKWLSVRYEHGLDWQEILTWAGGAGIVFAMILAVILTANKKLKKEIGCRLRAQEKLSASERKYRQLLQSIPHRVFYKDRNSVYIAANPAYASDFGLLPDEVEGKTDFDLHPEELAKQYRKNDQRIMEHEEPEEYEQPMLTRTGKIYTRIVKAPVRNSAGEVMGVLGVVWDISRTKELELFKADVDRVMRHDLKTPLTGLISLPDLLLLDDNLTKEQRDVVTMIKESGSHLLNQIDMYQDLARIEAEEYRFIPKKVELIGLFRRLSNDLGVFATPAGVNLSFRLNDVPLGDARPSVVQADELLLYSILSNLIKNGIEASTAGKTVATAAIVTEDSLLLTVHNQGFVPDSIRNSFFEKYVTAGKTNGTGLGTYSARLMTGAMNGEIHLKTSRKEGTLLTVTLPQ